MRPLTSFAGQGVKSWGKQRMLPSPRGLYPHAQALAQLAHVEKNAVRAAYNRAQWLEQRRNMMNEWADYIDGLKEEARQELMTK